MPVEFFPLTQEQEQILKDLYYSRNYTRGRDSIFNYITKNHPEQQMARHQVADWLSKQETAQLFRQKKQSRPLITAKKTLHIDLIDMQTYSNNNYKYILTCIDTFSRKAWAYKLLNKIVNSVETFVTPLLNQNQFKVLSSDNGTEFNSNVPNGITHIRGNPYTHTNQSIVY